MDTIVFFLIFILILLLIYFIIVKKEDNINNKEIKLVKNNLDFDKDTHNDYNNNNNDFIDDINGCQYNDGYENELMYSNNLKDGDYANLFKETEIKNDVNNNNQIGFNPSPRKQMKTLPYANIHSKCLYEKNN